MSENELKSGEYMRMMLAAGLAYAAMVMPLSSLGVYITRDWGMSGFMAGLAGGAAFCMTLIRRKPAGELADRRGGKFSFVRGCWFHASGGCVAMLAAIEPLPLWLRFALLIAGRLLVGLGETMANIGMAHWAVARVGPGRTGRALATLGMCIYGAVAVGGWLGFFLFQRLGFAGLMAACALSPLLGYLLVRTCPAAPRDGSDRPAPVSYGDIMRRIWRLGLPSACVGVGFSVVGTFLAKTFLDRGWPHAGWGFTFCGIGFVVMRIFIGHLPDRIGGLRIALVSAAVEMVGLYLLWLAPGPYSALAGAFLTGAGISMIFPSLSMEIFKSVPPRMRGVSVSSYNIFIDLAYGFAGPLAGFFTDRLGDGVAYLFAAVAATVGFILIAGIVRRAAAGKGFCGE